MSGTCILLPAYNNCKTAGAVIRGALRQLPALIAVDDGSTDGTAEVLREFPGIIVIRHERNLGKGAALMSGFGKALSLGFDHAISIDADGQHLPDDIPRFLTAIGQDPGAIYVGSRKSVGARVPLTSLCANRFSDFWFRLESGARLPDTQCGFRSYPLRAIDRLRLEKTHYDFEVEVLVKAAWSGVPLKSIPVTVVYLSVAERVSHFRPVKDFLRISHLYTLFFIMRFFLPSILQEMLCDKSLVGVSFAKKLRIAAQGIFVESVSNPFNTSASIGLGLMIGILPIWGFQLITAVFLATRLRLNKFVAVAASNISFPAVIPLIFYCALVIGHALLSGSLDFSPALNGDLRRIAAEKFTEWALGSVVLAVAVALVGGAVSYIAITLINRAAERYRDA